MHSDETGRGEPTPVVPIFDALTHPTITGGWTPGRPQTSAHMDRLKEQMDLHDVKWALAVGMEGIGGYAEDEFASFVRRGSDRLLPVAFLNPSRFGPRRDLSRHVSSLRDKGYVGIKIHPRLSHTPLTHPNLPAAVNEAAEQGLVTLICTYPYAPGMDRDTYALDALVSLLDKTKGCKVILLHAGCVRLLEMIEIARLFDDVLLDLSFTICKYAGSSIDLDIAYAFRQFDRRVCIGSDFPEFDLKLLRERFSAFADGLPGEKIENIAYKNLLNFMGDIVL